jgi:hypothetical protein
MVPSPEKRYGPINLGNIQQPTSNIEHPMTATRACVGCWVLGVGCWVLGVGCWMLVVGCSPPLVQGLQARTPPFGRISPHRMWRGWGNRAHVHSPIIYNSSVRLRRPVAYLSTPCRPEVPSHQTCPAEVNGIQRVPIRPCRPRCSGPPIHSRIGLDPPRSDRDGAPFPVDPPSRSGVRLLPIRKITRN